MEMTRARYYLSKIITALTLFCFVGCKRDDSLMQVPLEGGHWEWVYSVDDGDIFDTVATPSTFGHSLEVVQAARGSEESMISVRYYLDENLIELHHIKAERYETIYEGPDGVVLYSLYGTDGRVLNWYVSQNPTKSFRGFYSYGMPIDLNGLHRVKNYFKFVRS